MLRHVAPVKIFVPFLYGFSGEELISRPLNFDRIFRLVDHGPQIKTLDFYN